MPENTLAGFAAALSIGVTTLELDLGMTKDGVVVVSHDSHLNPDHTRGADGAFLNGKGPAIRSLTLAELKRYDVGRLKPGTAIARACPSSARSTARPSRRWPRCSIWSGAPGPITSGSTSKPRSRPSRAPRSPTPRRSRPRSCATCGRPEWRRAFPCSRSTGGRWPRSSGSRPKSSCPASPSNGNGATTCSAADAGPRPGRLASTSMTSKARPRAWSRPRDAPIWSPMFQDLSPVELAEAKVDRAQGRALDGERAAADGAADPGRRRWNHQRLSGPAARGHAGGRPAAAAASHRPAKPAGRRIPPATRRHSFAASRTDISEWRASAAV